MSKSDVVPYKPTGADLLSTFAANCSKTLSQNAEPLAAVLSALIDATCGAWPAVALSEQDFVAYLAQRVSDNSEPVTALHSRRIGELFLACACSKGDKAALAHFETHYASKVDRALKRLNLSEAMIDEVHQRLRCRLLVAEPGALPGITKFSGRGKLVGWISVTAVRIGLELLKQQERWTPCADEDVANLTAHCDSDPELRYLKHLYRHEFKAAFRSSVALLTSRERNLLRYQMIDGLSIDEIGALHKVHRSTAARWLARIRQSLALSVQNQMTHELGIPNGDYESILRLIYSRIELSLGRHLAATSGGKLDDPHEADFSEVQPAGEPSSPRTLKR